MLHYAMRFFSGQVKVTVQGKFTERFLNVLSRRKIKIWDIEKHEGILIFFVANSDVKRLKKPARECAVSYEVGQTDGLPKVYEKYRRRFMLVSGIFICVLSLAALSQFIWSVRVVGNETLTEEFILEQLEKHDVKAGTFKQSLDLADIINTLKLEIPELAFIAINFNGTVADIEIKERVPKPLDRDPTELRNIIAKHDGQIETIEVYEGHRLVEAGDVVQKGDLLVSSAVPLINEDVYFVPSDAKIEARIWESGTIKAPRIASLKVITNNEEKRYSINFSGFMINLHLNTSISMPTYDTIRSEEKLTLPFGIETDISLICDTAREYYTLTRVQNDEELIALCEAKLVDFEKTLGLSELVDIKKDIEITDDAVYLHFTIEGIMDIVEYAVLTDLDLQNNEDNQTEDE